MMMVLMMMVLVMMVLMMMVPVMMVLVMMVLMIMRLLMKLMKFRLEAQERLLKLKERKKRTRFLIEIGGLAGEANILPCSHI